MLEWTVIHADDPILQPVYDQPPCPGPTIHTWTLAIEEGQLSLHSKCSECDEGVLMHGVEAIEMEPIPGRLEFHYENGIEPYYWWEFHPDGTSNG